VIARKITWKIAVKAGSPSILEFPSFPARRSSDRYKMAARFKENAKMRTAMPNVFNATMLLAYSKNITYIHGRIETRFHDRVVTSFRTVFSALLPLYCRRILKKNI